MNYDVKEQGERRHPIVNKRVTAAIYQIRTFAGHYEVWEMTDDAWIKDFTSHAAAEEYIRSKT